MTHLMESLGGFFAGFDDDTPARLKAGSVGALAAGGAPAANRIRISCVSEPVFLFADLSGYTALTEVHGDEEAADLVLGFADEVRAMLPATGPRR